MRKGQFEKLVQNAGLYVVHSGIGTPRFAVALRNGNKGYQRSIFDFDPYAFRMMTEQETLKYIKECKESMKRERERIEEVTRI